MLGQVGFKRSDRHNVVYIRREGPYETVSPVFKEVADWCASKGLKMTGPMIGIYHDEPKGLGVNLTWSRYAPEKCRTWACAQVEGKVPDDPKVKSLSMYPVDVVSVDYDGAKGQFDTAATYRKLKEYIEKNDLTMSGPVREIYQSYPMDAGPNTKVRIEIQVPVCNVGNVP